MKVGPKSSLRPFLHRALQLLLGKGSQGGGEGDGRFSPCYGPVLPKSLNLHLKKVLYFWKL